MTRCASLCFCRSFSPILGSSFSFFPVSLSLPFPLFTVSVSLARVLPLFLSLNTPLVSPICHVVLSSSICLPECTCLTPLSCRRSTRNCFTVSNSVSLPVRVSHRFHVASPPPPNCFTVAMLFSYIFPIGRCLQSGRRVFDASNCCALAATCYVAWLERTRARLPRPCGRRYVLKGVVADDLRYDGSTWVCTCLRFLIWIFYLICLFRTSPPFVLTLATFRPVSSFLSSFFSFTSFFNSLMCFGCFLICVCLASYSCSAEVFCLSLVSCLSDRSCTPISSLSSLSHISSLLSLSHLPLSALTSLIYLTHLSRPLIVVPPVLLTLRIPISRISSLGFRVRLTGSRS